MQREARAAVTPVRQRTQFSCMAASMAMCLRALGHEVTEDEVNRVMGARPMQGAAWEQALACAQHYGCRATLTMPATVEQLKAWTDAGVPVMIAWNPEGRPWSHASVVFDVDADLNVYVADPNIPNPKETVRVVSEDDFYHKWFEKFPDYLVRRPACAIEREITVTGQQIAPRTASMRTASDQRPKSKWDRLPLVKQPFGWASPAPGIDGTVPMPWRVTHADRALAWLKTQFDYTDIYTDYESDKYQGRERIWVGLRDNRDKQAHYTRLLLMHEELKEQGWPVMRDNRRNALWLIDDLPRDVLRGRRAKGPTTTPKTQEERRREQNTITVERSTPRNDAARALAERGGKGQGSHKNKQDYDRGHARQPKHRNQDREAMTLDRLVASYSGNPDGEPIYPVQVDHGEEHALSGGHDVMKRLQDQLRIEQGGTARENQETRLARWNANTSEQVERLARRFLARETT